MKTFSSIVSFLLISASTVFAQTAQSHPLPPKPPFLITEVIPSAHQSGNSNYMVSLSDGDLKSKKYVMYTDSNATLAYININGNDVELTGGPNPEHILAYTSKYFTVTLSISKKTPVASGNKDDQGMMKIEGRLCVYNSKGQMVAKDITGYMNTAVKN